MRRNLLLFVVISLCLTSALFSQPYGLTERIPNTSFLISTPDSIPETISESGVFSDVETQTPAPGLIPYSVNSELWSDAAVKTRYIALPGTSKIEFSVDGAWVFPRDAVLVKNFYLDLERGNPESRKIVETRFLVQRRDNSGWDGYSYMWNDEGTDATLLDDSATKTFTITDSSVTGGSSEQEYYFPSFFDCLKCHTFAAKHVLGVKTSQINKEVDFDGVIDNQLRSYNHIGLFTEDIGENYTDFPLLFDPLKNEGNLEQRARSYLDANCAQCHRPLGPGITNMDFRFSTPLEQANYLDAPPVLDDFGIQGARLIKSGSPDSSIIYLRLTSTTQGVRMPPLATSIVDENGTDVVKEWILSLRGGVSSIADEGSETPESFQLLPAFPNPFNPSTTLSYSLSSAGDVQLEIYDFRGRRVKKLVDSHQNAGFYSVHWDATDEMGRRVAGGIYFYKLQAGDSTAIRKMIFIK